MRAGELWQACSKTYDPSYYDLPVWGALVNITAKCLPYSAALPDQTAHGLLWDINVQRLFAEFLERFNNETGMDVGFESANVRKEAREQMPMWPSAASPGSFDFWMVGAEAFGEAFAHSAFTDLTFLLNREDHYMFADIPVAWRSAVSSAFTGSYSALPLTVLPWLLMYRRDVFSAYGITVPQTWDDVLAVAEQYGQGQLGSGQPDLGFCFESNPECGSAPTIMGYILASMVQLTGPRHGSWFDSGDFQPLYTTAAMREALRLYVALRRHSVDDSTACSEVYAMLASGRCLMLMGPSYVFKRGSAVSGPLRGRQGVSPCPGSARALHRPTGRLVPCTRELCPYATPAAANASASVNASTSPTTAAGHANAFDSPPEAAAPVLVNRVFPLASVSFAINAFSPLPRQAAAFALLHTFTSPDQHRAMQLMPTSDLVPLRLSDLDEQLWVNAGYEPCDVQSFMDASRAFLNAPNVFVELRIPGAFDVLALVHKLVRQAVWGNYSYDDMMSYAATATEEIVRRAGGKDYLLPLYRKSVDFSILQPTPGAPTRTISRRLQVPLISALVASMAVLVVAAAALWGFVWYSRRRHAAAAAMRAAPGAGPATTLLVTDIQDSTSLWESLTADVMDTAVRVHHRIVRELLLPYKGYESATEGDSFIVAFDRPDRALSFALVAQEALMRADWPTQLSASEFAATLSVGCDAAVASAVLPCLAPSRLRDAISSCLGAAVRAAAVLLPASGSNMGAGGAAPSPFATAAAAAAAAVSGRRSLDLYASADIAGSRRWPRAGTMASSVLSAVCVSGAGRSTLSGHGGFGGGRMLSEPREQSSPQILRHHASSKVLRPPPLNANTKRPGSENIGFVAIRNSLMGVGGGLAGGSNGSRMSVDRGRLAPSRTCTGSRLASGSGLRPEALIETVNVVTGKDDDDDGDDDVLLQGAELGPPSIALAAPATLLEMDDGSSNNGTDVDGLGSSGPSPPRGCSGPRSAGGSAAAAVTAAATTPFTVPALALGELIAQMFPPVPAAAAAAECAGSGAPPSGVVMFRGLRVRMGLHCGVLSSEVQFNRASSRTVYSGRTLQLAKAVSDAGHGGQVLMSSAVRAALEGKAGGGGVAASTTGGELPYIILSAGQHLLREDMPATELYGAFSRGLLPRAGHMQGLRSIEEQVPGVLSAPLGRVALAVVLLQDSEELAAWGLEVSLENHRAMTRVAARIVRQQQGYLLHTLPGSFKAVFTRPCAALYWMLDLQEELGPAPGGDPGAPVQTFPLQSLQTLPLSSSAGSSNDSDAATVLLRRAVAVTQLATFQLKGGVDVGSLQSTLVPNGSMSYSGSTVRRATCLAASAASHEVLISLEAAREVLTEVDPGAAAWPAFQSLMAVRSKRRRRTSVVWEAPETALAPCPDQASSESRTRLLTSTTELPSRFVQDLRGLPPAADGNAPLGSATSPARPVGPELRAAPRSSQMLAICSAAVAPTIVGPLALGTEVRVIKCKGGAFEACSVALAGRCGGGDCTGAGGGGCGGGVKSVPVSGTA